MLLTIVGIRRIGLYPDNFRRIKKKSRARVLRCYRSLGLPVRMQWLVRLLRSGLLRLRPLIKRLSHTGNGQAERVEALS